MNYIQFMNTNENLIVTGDYGNWIFCRPFIPSSDGFVSDCYWLEKLKISSSQELSKYDPEETEKSIQKLLDSELEEYGYEGEELENLKSELSHLLYYVDDEIEYNYNAYRDSSLDYEQIPYETKLNYWLLIIFDAFDEICNRIKNEKQ